MKQIGKEKMQTVAKEVFEHYPKCNKVAVTSDGQAFIVDHGDAAAKNHAQNNIHGKELSVVTFLRDDVMQANADQQNTVGTKAVDLIAEIEKADTIEAVQAILGDDTRKTVVAAAEARIDALKGGE